MSTPYFFSYQRLCFLLWVRRIGLSCRDNRKKRFECDECLCRVKKGIQVVILITLGGLVAVFGQYNATYN